MKRIKRKTSLVGFQPLIMSIFIFLLFYKVWTAPVLISIIAFIFLLHAYIRSGGETHGNGIARIEKLAQHSPMNRCHPGLKVCFSLFCTLWTVGVSNNINSIFVWVSMSFITVVWGEIPLNRYLKLLMVPLTFILPGTFGIMFSLSPVPVGYLDLPIGSWYLCLTREGQALAHCVFLRSLGAVACLYYLALTTPLHNIIGVLQQVKVPLVMIELMYLIYRYIFLLMEVSGQMKVSGESRLGYRNFVTSVKTVSQHALHLLFFSFRRSSACFTAMESRCYNGKIRFWEAKVKLGGKEVIFVTFYTFLLVLLWIFTERF